MTGVPLGTPMTDRPIVPIRDTLSTALLLFLLSDITSEDIVRHRYNAVEVKYKWIDAKGNEYDEYDESGYWFPSDDIF